jgi:hypothetical protein
VKIAQILARAGLHLAPITVRRMLHDRGWPGPCGASEKSPRAVTARHPNQVWHVDDRSHGARILDFVASLHSASDLVLLVAHRDRRSLLPADDGIRGLPQFSLLGLVTQVPRDGFPEGGSVACLPNLRPRHAVH